MHSRPATTRADLALPGIGTLAVRVTRLEHGRVRYTVRGPHIRGTLVVVPEAVSGGTVLPSTVAVQYGDGTDSIGSHYDDHRPDEPVIFNVRLHGWSGGIDPDAPPSGWFLGTYASSLRDNGVHRGLSSGVRRRTETVLLAILRHWSSLTNRHDLLAAAAGPTAAEFADREAELALHCETESAALETERAQVRRRLNVLTGIIRRRPLPVLPPDPAPVKVPLLDSDGHPLGVLSVREIAVSEGMPGTVVYEAAGPRTLGRFTVGRNRFRPEPMPEGIRVTYGHVRSRSPYSDKHEHEPAINGVRIGGIWDCSHAARITATTPARLPTTARTGVRARMSASEPTERRASAVLRALALRYLARSDTQALRLAAAQEDAPRRRNETREELRELRARHHEVRARAVRHRERERQYRHLAAGTAAPSGGQHTPTN
ncbi:hypothetical protein [Streptomyces sp. NPDC001889]